jgi:hypothetical protein
MNPVNPKKLLLTKWTAVKPVAKQKHFLVSWVSQPEPLTYPIEMVEIEAFFYAGSGDCLASLANP